tara:strand:+ start:363 stop:944 length:582 start_codon:yes stop_codon:yes gene_type:complete
MSEDKESTFEILSKIDTTSMSKKKGQYEYIPWSVAMREVLKVFPDASWEVINYDNLPYLKTDVGYFVACSVTINELTRSIMLPVLDYRNNVIPKPNASQINNSQMRALTKALALHGFGLSMWAGEDINDDEQKVKEEKPAYPQDRFDANLEDWGSLINQGKTHQGIVNNITAKYTLTDEQVKTIISIGVNDAK